MTPHIPAPRTGPSDAGDAFVSGDAVSLDVRVASLGSRGLARLIDLVLQAILAVVVFLVLGMIVSVIGAADQATAATVQVIAAITGYLGYPVLMQTLTRGRTVGKSALGLRVVRDDGGAVGFRHVLTRELVGFAAEVPGLMPPLTWFVSIWTMLSNPASKRVGDLAAGTLVIHDRTPVVWSWIPTMPRALATWVTTVDMAALDDSLALSVRQFLLRYGALRPAARESLGRALAAEVAARISPAPPPGTRDADLMSAVLAERHHRSVRRLVAARTSTGVVWPELVALTGAQSPYRMTPAGGLVRPGSALPAVPPAPGTVPLQPPPGYPRQPVPPL